MLLATLAALIAWEALGLDLTLSGFFGDAGGFAARDAWWARAVLHDTARWVSAACVAALVGEALLSPETGAARARKIYWMAVVLVTLVAIPLLKRVTATSCPWDLGAFGGVAAYVPHWRLGVTDGGPGHCFPAGHPVAAFAFVGLYYRWRPSRRLLAVGLLVLAVCSGALLGWSQMARGAHFASHVLWSAWLAAAIAVGARHFEPDFDAAASKRIDVVPAQAGNQFP